MSYVWGSLLRCSEGLSQKPTLQALAGLGGRWSLAFSSHPGPQTPNLMTVGRPYTHTVVPHRPLCLLCSPPDLHAEDPGIPDASLWSSLPGGVCRPPWLGAVPTSTLSEQGTRVSAGASLPLQQGREVAGHFIPVCHGQWTLRSPDTPRLGLVGFAASDRSMLPSAGVRSPGTLMSWKDLLEGY